MPLRLRGKLGVGLALARAKIEKRSWRERNRAETIASYCIAKCWGTPPEQIKYLW